MIDAGVAADGSPVWRVRNRHSRLCLNVKAASIRRGAPIIQWRCTNARNGRWKMRFYSGNIHQFINENSNMCMNVKRASRSNGAPLIQYPCVGARNEAFDMVRAG